MLCLVVWRVRYSTTYLWWGALSLRRMVYPLVHTLLPRVHPPIRGKVMYVLVVWCIHTPPAHTTPSTGACTSACTPSSGGSPGVRGCMHRWCTACTMHSPPAHAHHTVLRTGGVPSLGTHSLSAVPGVHQACALLGCMRGVNPARTCGTSLR